MAELDRYIPGVPCWIDTTQPDPDAAAEFYAGLFGWELEDTMPADAPGKYLQAQLNGGLVAAVSSPHGRRRAPRGLEHLHLGGERRRDRRQGPRGRRRGRDGAVRHLRLRPDGVVRGSRGRRVRRLAAEPAPRRAGRQRAGQPQLQRPPQPRRGAREGVLRRGVRLGGCCRWACGRCPRTATTSRRSTPGRGSGRARWAGRAASRRSSRRSASITGRPARQPAHWDVTFGVADADATAERGGGARRDGGGAAVRRALDPRDRHPRPAAARRSSRTSSSPRTRTWRPEEADMFTGS